jgi:hypothetical protein
LVDEGLGKNNSFLVGRRQPSAFPSCDALVLIMRNGKTNKFHKVEYIRKLGPPALPPDFFWRWGYVVTDPTAKQPGDPIPPHRRLPSRRLLSPARAALARSK